MKEYIVDYHFADGNKIGRIMHANDDDAALRNAVLDGTEPVMFTDSRGVLYYFKFENVLYVKVHENKARKVQVKGF